MSPVLLQQETLGREEIRLEKIEKSFGDLPVLNDISLSIYQGEIIALLGASGCGKSTLLNIISGLMPPERGEITLQGEPLSRFRRWSKLGYLFQEDRLLPWRTVRQNVNFGLEAGNVSRQERKVRAGEVLQLVGLEKFADAWPHQLSGGMRSRVALARSLVVEPEILLMDEPFSKLDPQIRSAMHDELLRIQRLKNMTIVMVTHDVEEAVVLADRVVILKPNPGRIDQISAIDLPRPRIPTAKNVAEQIRLLRLEV